MRYLSRIIALLFVVTIPTPALAYVGPGLGLGAIVIILALVISILLAVISLFWYPIKRKFDKYTSKDKPGEPNEHTDGGG